MSIKFRDEALRHMERYEIYKDSPDDWIRRKVSVELDRFLMEHREEVIKLVVEANNVNKRPFWRRG